MTINPDLDRELALVVERESLAVAVRVLGLLYAEVVRLEREIERIEGGCKSMAVDLTTLGRLHTNAKPGHGYAIMAGEHTPPASRISTPQPYALHKHNCDLNTGAITGLTLPCSCGLDALLTQQSEE